MQVRQERQILSVLLQWGVVSTPSLGGWVHCYQLGTGSKLETSHSFLLLEDRVIICFQNSFEEDKFLLLNMYITSGSTTRASLFIVLWNSPWTIKGKSLLRKSFDDVSLKSTCFFAMDVHGWHLTRNTNILKFWAYLRGTSSYPS